MSYTVTHEVGTDTNKPAQDVKREREEFGNERTDWGSKNRSFSVRVCACVFLSICTRVDSEGQKKNPVPHPACLARGSNPGSSGLNSDSV